MFFEFSKEVFRIHLLCILHCLFMVSTVHLMSGVRVEWSTEEGIQIYYPSAWGSSNKRHIYENKTIMSSKFPYFLIDADKLDGLFHNNLIVAKRRYLSYGHCINAQLELVSEQQGCSRLGSSKTQRTYFLFLDGMQVVFERKYHILLITQGHGWTFLGRCHAQASHKGLWLQRLLSWWRSQEKRWSNSQLHKAKKVRDLFFLWEGIGTSKRVHSWRTQFNALRLPKKVVIINTWVKIKHVWRFKCGKPLDSPFLFRFRRTREDSWLICSKCKLEQKFKPFSKLASEDKKVWFHGQDSQKREVQDEEAWAQSWREGGKNFEETHFQHQEWANCSLVILVKDKAQLLWASFVEPSWCIDVVGWLLK